jgi:HD-GYP domain-containing protein (c-di-GMP phosphodiesterase class II)
MQRPSEPSQRGEAIARIQEIMKGLRDLKCLDAILDRLLLEARRLVGADVYDALISRRVYKPAYPEEQAVAILRAESSRRFDPEVLEAFFAIDDDVVGAIRKKYREAEGGAPPAGG